MVRDDGRCVFGQEASALIYDPHLGLFRKGIETAEEF